MLTKHASADMAFFEYIEHLARWYAYYTRLLFRMARVLRIVVIVFLLRSLSECRDDFDQFVN